MSFDDVGVSSTMDYESFEECDLGAMKTEEDALLETIKTTDNVFVSGAKIDGSYEDYLKILVQQHGARGRVDNVNEEMIGIDSIDGAEYLKSEENVTSIISYSSQMFSLSMITENKISAGSSTNILTWQQVRGGESTDVMIPSVQHHYENKSTLYNKPNYQLYDMYDAKMLYSLTVHSQWNRKTQPISIM